jgi:hypothetical protein
LDSTITYLYPTGYANLDNTKAISHLQIALTLAKSAADKIVISNKILECKQTKTTASNKLPFKAG